MTQATCVMTRIELRHAWMTPILWLHFFRVRAALRKSDGVIASTIAFESIRSIFTISIWSKPRALLDAATYPHVYAVRDARKWSRHMWSSQWHLTRLSPSARDWPSRGIDWSEVARLSGSDGLFPAAFTVCRGEIIHQHPQSDQGALNHNVELS
jgi:hypothetical protein